MKKHKLDNVFVATDADDEGNDILMHSEKDLQFIVHLNDTRTWRNFICNITYVIYLSASVFCSFMK